jgi:regulator of protease activity HflC (stomatin/prohibitin superfamily)
MKRILFWTAVVLSAGIVTGIIKGILPKETMLMLIPFLFIRFVMVEEGTAKAITSFGRFQKIIFEWQGHSMDRNWSVKKSEEVEAKERRRSSGRLIGGLYFYFWPFQKIHEYSHRWYDIRLRPGGKIEVEFHEFQDKNLFNLVLLKPAVYATKIFQVETAPPERIPLDVIALITLRINNPYRFLFVAPPTPIEDILSRMNAMIRAMITGIKLDDLLGMKGESLWSRGDPKSLLGENKLINETLNKWGVSLADKGIEIQDVGIPDEYQRMGAAQKAEDMKAAGRAKEIMGTVFYSLTQTTGKGPEELQAEFNKNPKKFYEENRELIKNVLTKLSMESKSYLRIETPEAGDLLGSLISLIGAFKGMPALGAGKENINKKTKTSKNSSGKEVINYIKKNVEETKKEQE